METKRINKYLVAALIFFTLSMSTANASLLTNGDFDNDLDMQDKTWYIFDKIDGWEAGQYDAGIEVLLTSAGLVQAHSGDKYIELDAHASERGANTSAPGTNSSMTQTLDLDSGSYMLEFYYQPRTHYENDNGIRVNLAGQQFEVDDVTPGEDQYIGWQHYSTIFSIAAFGTYDLKFEAIGDHDTPPGSAPGNSLGGLIDTVSLKPVPIPPTLLLLSTGIFGLIGYRKNRQES